jgi:[protein-PII] uridylyltransferase
VATALAPLPAVRPPLAASLAADVRTVEELGRILAARLAEGRAAIRAFFEAGGAPELVHRELAELVDELVRGALDWADRRLFGSANRTTGERLAVVAVGGYGRAELAPFSDVDLLFLHPYKPAPYVEQMTEFLVRRLWDLGFKVGNALRTAYESIKLAKEDLSVRTALLEARFLWGERSLFEELVRAYDREVRLGHGPEFIEAKLAERDERHRRTGDSRYLLEPNVKEGKGGLRDLQTLMWIGRFLYAVKEPAELVDKGVLTPRALATFRRSRRFLWAVRCHLHWTTGRAEERLTFELQPEIARRMGFRAHGKQRPVERFMKRYYLVAKEVGALTRIVCAALEDQHQRRTRFRLPRFGFGRRRIGGFEIHGARIALAEPDLFERRPVAMLELFHLAQEKELDVHPQGARRRSGPEPAAGGRGAARRPGSQPTVPRDADSRARMPRSTLSAPERGRSARPVRAGVRPRSWRRCSATSTTSTRWTSTRSGRSGCWGRSSAVSSRSELPLATSKSCPSSSDPHRAVPRDLLPRSRQGSGRRPQRGRCRDRRTACAAGFGTAEAVTETVRWLVRHHLLMSDVAFKRDLDDPKTVQDFVAIVQSPERLAAPAGVDRGRHPRGRPQRVERLEGSAPARPLYHAASA